MTDTSVIFRSIIGCCLFVSLMLCQAAEVNQQYHDSAHLRSSYPAINDVNGSPKTIKKKWFYIHHLKHCSEKELYQRVKQISLYPSIPENVREVLIQLENSNTFKFLSGTPGDDSLAFFGDESHLYKVEKVLNAIDIPWSSILIEAIILKTDMTNTFSANQDFSKSMSVGDVVFYKGRSFQSLTDLKIAFCDDPDIELIALPVTTTSVEITTSLYETIIQRPHRGPHSFDVRFNASVIPWLLSQNVCLNIRLENILSDGEYHFNGTPNWLIPHLCSFVEPERLEALFISSSRSFIVWHGVPIEDRLKKKLAGMIILGAPNRVSLIPDKVMTLIIQPTILQIHEPPQLDNLF